MRYKVYYKGDRCLTSYKDDLCIFDMTSGVNLDEYIKNMSEPTITVNEDDYVIMTFEPIPSDIAILLVQEDKLRFQVVRHKANSSHGQLLNFPYSFVYPKFIYGLSIPNNGPDSSWNIVTSPTLEELTSGVIERDMSGLFDNIRLCKCQTKDTTLPWDAEFYFGFIYWKAFHNKPDTFKMAYYHRREE